MRTDYQKSINDNFGVQTTQGVRVNIKPDERLNENYTCKDQNWHTGTYNGDIYISTPNETHNEILKHYSNPEYKIPENGYPGTSGFFTDESTASKHFTGEGTFDSVGLGHDLQQSPYYDASAAMEAQNNRVKYNPEYNSNLDCFRANSDKMLENYGTTDFYAAQSRCTENTAWGEGGGFQGYNPHINEMINNGSLEYIPERSRRCSDNECLDYSSRKAQSSQEASAVNEHIEKNNVKGEPGERIGYNELSRTNAKQDGPTIRNDNAGGVSSGNIESTGGGGARAPNNIRGNADNQSIGKAPSQSRGTRPASEDNTLPNRSTLSERGRKPSENENKPQGNNTSPRGERPQEAPQNASNASQTQRGAPPGSPGVENSKAPISSSSNPSNKVSASSNSAKAIDEASKVASDQTAQNVAPKPNGIGM